MKVSVFILASALSFSLGAYAQQSDQKENKAGHKNKTEGSVKGHADPNLEQEQKDPDKKDASIKVEDRSMGAVMRYTIVVKGKVQDVGFRNAAKLKARSLDLRGEARNETDGTVFIEVEGPKSKLDEFVEFCKKGPDKAEVTDVSVKKSTQLKDFKEFDVDRVNKDKAPREPMKGEAEKK
jgi:acylphosphatase